MAEERNFALPPLGKATLAMLFVIAVMPPVAAAAVFVLQVRDGAATPLLALALQACLAVGVVAALLVTTRRRVGFDGRRLRVAAAFLTRESALDQFDLAAARVVDLREHVEFKPRWKTFAVALPGLQSGDFRLRDWRRRAFCLITDPARVLVLPHADGRVWLLSFTHPQAVLDILRRAAG